MTILEHPKTPPLENYVRIFALTPELQSLLL